MTRPPPRPAHPADRRYGARRSDASRTAAIEAGLRTLAGRIRKQRPFAVVKVPHHGSSNGLDPAVLDDLGDPVTPGTGVTYFGIITGRKSNDHPDLDVLADIHSAYPTASWARTDPQRPDHPGVRQRCVVRDADQPAAGRHDAAGAALGSGAPPGSGGWRLRRRWWHDPCARGHDGVGSSRPPPRDQDRAEPEQDDDQLHPRPDDRQGGEEDHDGRPDRKHRELAPPTRVLTAHDEAGQRHARRARPRRTRRRREKTRLAPKIATIPPRMSMPMRSENPSRPNTIASRIVAISTTIRNTTKPMIATIPSRRPATVVAGARSSSPRRPGARTRSATPRR